MNQHLFRQTLLLFTVIVILFAVMQQTAMACPTCKNGLAEGQENVAQGYFWSILFMMSMPFLIFGSLGLYFYLAIRRARVRNAQQSEESLAAPATSTYDKPACTSDEAGELIEV